jgi:glycosyltransferase involved in cell wall biosynthesis
MTADSRLPISVCLISGAEAARIRRALASVAGWTSEIIVVLNEEANDGTAEIAAEFGAKVFREPWKGHIAQKNSAADKATQLWVLGLDADEEISPDLRAEIQQALTAPGDSVAFCFPRCTFFCGRWIRHGDWYPDRQTRLWRSGQARWGGEDPHDKLLVQGRIGTLRGEMLHFSNPTIASYITKINYFSDIYLRQQLAEKRRWSAASAVIRSAWRFIRGYIIRLGFLDGYPGFFIAASTAYGTLVRHSRLYEHLHSQSSSCPPQKSR